VARRNSGRIVHRAAARLADDVADEKDVHGANSTGAALRSSKTPLFKNRSSREPVRYKRAYDDREVIWHHQKALQINLDDTNTARSPKSARAGSGALVFPLGGAAGPSPDDLAYDMTSATPLRGGRALCDAPAPAKHARS